MSPKKWIEATEAIGIISKAGRYGGTYAQRTDGNATAVGRYSNCRYWKR